MNEWLLGQRHNCREREIMDDFTVPLLNGGMEGEGL